MRTFPAPAPLGIEITLVAGTARVIASDRDDVVVDVQPRDPHDAGEVDAAARTRVALVAGRLEVAAPRPRAFGLLGRTPVVDVVVEAPSGSSIRASSGYGDLVVDGRVAECVLETKAGDVRVEEAARLRLASSSGSIMVGRTTGPADLVTSSGSVRVGEVGGRATLRTAYGDVWVDRALADVHARTAYGQLRVGSAVRGALTLATSYGTVEVGIPEGTAAYLDVVSDHGQVSSDLRPSDEPSGEGSGDRVTVSARTSYGSITIRRA